MGEVNVGVIVTCAESIGMARMSRIRQDQELYGLHDELRMLLLSPPVASWKDTILSSVQLSIASSSESSAYLHHVQNSPEYVVYLEIRKVTF